MGLFKPNITKMHGKKDINCLVKALKHKDLYIRERAAQALGHIADARATEHLIDALEDKESYVRHRAAQALGEIGDARAVAPLVKALRDKDDTVRQDAVEALSRIRDEGALRALVRVCQGRRETKLRVAAIEALEAFGRTEDVGVESLINALRSRKNHVKVIAARSLRKIGAETAIGPLFDVIEPLSFYDHKDHPVSREAAKAIRSAGKPGMDFIIQALSNESELVQSKALRALGEICDAEVIQKLKHPRASESLLKGLGHQDLVVREKAARLLLQSEQPKGKLIARYYKEAGRPEKTESRVKILCELAKDTNPSIIKFIEREMAEWKGWPSELSCLVDEVLERKDRRFKNALTIFVQMVDRYASHVTPGYNDWEDWYSKGMEHREVDYLKQLRKRIMAYLASCKRRN